MKHEIHRSAFAAAVQALARFVREESGDDLVEYALLTTTVGLVGAAAMTFFSSQIAAAYQTWNWQQQNLSYETPSPAQ